MAAHRIPWLLQRQDDVDLCLIGKSDRDIPDGSEESDWAWQARTQA